MKIEMIAICTCAYEFLRSIGAVTDEPDGGLELPVTVEVMQDRVDFLHKLGLTIEDINNYPRPWLQCEEKHDSSARLPRQIGS
ncbi:transcription termination factor MTERF4, chloroplastic [Olea europaea subsp. europaea]|uniref:Transcription termination factor MTERF4, chloroplastic n=1 Tax=Olea europaea subsp. europaea TaxID=158383 RepID=A0A8S0VFL8_OLEEU|nr:transcription termination factor MTERF4, chloroplastic [Olea europaea subsp. europaea]